MGQQWAGIIINTYNTTYCISFTYFLIFTFYCFLYTNLFKWRLLSRIVTTNRTWVPNYIKNSLKILGAKRTYSQMTVGIRNIIIKSLNFFALLAFSAFTRPATTHTSPLSLQYSDKMQAAVKEKFLYAPVKCFANI